MLLHSVHQSHSRPVLTSPPVPFEICKWDGDGMGRTSSVITPVPSPSHPVGAIVRAAKDRNGAEMRCSFISHLSPVPFAYFTTVGGDGRQNEMGREFCVHQSWDGTVKWETGWENGRGREMRRDEKLRSSVAGRD